MTNFYFYKSPKKKLKLRYYFKKEIPEIISRVKWKKSMKWGEYNLYWEDHLNQSWHFMKIKY